MKILIVEPYFTGSHQQWIEGLIKHSQHQIEAISLRGKYWKWRMSGGAISLVKKVHQLGYFPDLILATDMLDLALFKALLDIKFRDIPCWIYFHENQLTYPFQNPEKVDRHYGFINYTSALVADRVFFNSNYHRLSFFIALENFLKILPDERNLDNISLIKSKSKVLPLGLELSSFNSQNKSDIPVFLWNHRWEYDKNPVLFFETLFELKKRGYSFRLNVLGESFAEVPPIFNQAKSILVDRVNHWGYVENKEKYFDVVNKSNLVLVTSNQDFFGISVVEAIAAGCYPLLPNRLAFPEVVPFSKYFYQKDDHVLDQAMEALEAKKYLQNQEDLLKHVAKYDWKTTINQYDDLFKQC